MTNESSTASYMSGAMTSTGMTENTGENTMAPSSPRGIEFYVHCATIIMGGVGTAFNGLVLYALVASKQQKKYILIFHQNVADFFACLSLTIIYIMRLFNIYLTGSVGYWLCLLLFNDILFYVGHTGSLITLATISIERYLKIVHSARSKKILRNRMVYYLAMIISWIFSSAAVIPVVSTSVVIDGVCYAYMILDKTFTLIYFMWHFLSFYVLMLFIFIFCYWSIVVVIRRQARVMAGHSAAGPSAGVQSNNARNNVIMTMILVSVLYALTHFMGYVCFLLFNMYPYPLPLESIFYGSALLEYSYICISNPLIYAANFNPVKTEILRMIRRQEET